MNPDLSAYIHGQDQVSLPPRVYRTATGYLCALFSHTPHTQPLPPHSLCVLYAELSSIIYKPSEYSKLQQLIVPTTGLHAIAVVYV